MGSARGNPYLSINGSIEYSSPAVSVAFEDGFVVSSAEAVDGASDGAVSLEPAATMYALWKGIAESMPEIPNAEAGGTRIGAPDLGS